MREGWKKQTLGQLGECAIGLTYTPSDVCQSGGTLVLRASNIRNGRIVYGDDVFVSSVVPDTAKVRKGDILICVRNGSRDLVGKCAIIDERAAGHAFGAFMAVFRGSNCDFIYQLFHTNEFRRQIRRNLGATINQITNKNLREFEFLIPPQREQHEIAKLLNLWDVAIEKIERLIDLKESSFLALRERLAWHADAAKHNGWVKLGQVLKPATQRVGDGRELRVFSITKDGLIPQEEHFKKRIANENISRHMLVRCGNFVLSGLNFWMGSVDVSLNVEDICISPDYKVFALANAVEPRYFRHLVRTAEFVRILRGAAVERASIVRRNFDRTTFIESEIPLGSREQQLAIASALDAAENEIRILRDQRQALDRQKRGLMQKVLSGKWSVPVHEDHAHGRISRVAEEAAQ